MYNRDVYEAGGGSAPNYLASSYRPPAAPSGGGGLSPADAALRAAQIQADAQRAAAEMMAGASSEAIGFQRESLAAQIDMMNRALGIQQDMYNKNVGRLKPWVDSGKWALGKLTGESGMIKTLMPDTSPDKYEKSPYYNFLLSEGTKARDRSAAAHGLLNSGAHEKEITRFGQGLASTDYNDWFNRKWTDYFNKLTPYQQLSNTGESAAAQTGAIGTNYANAASNILGRTAGNEANIYSNMGNLLMQGAGQQAQYLTNAADATASGVFNSAMIPYQQNLYNQDMSLSRYLADKRDNALRTSDFINAGAAAVPYLAKFAGQFF